MIYEVLGVVRCSRLPKEVQYSGGDLLGVLRDQKAEVH